MIMKIEMEHAICAGKEKDALDLIQKINRMKGIQLGNASTQKSFRQDNQHGAQIPESVPDYMELLSELKTLSSTSAQVRIHISA